MAGQTPTHSLHHPPTLPGSSCWIIGGPATLSLPLLLLGLLPLSLLCHLLHSPTHPVLGTQMDATLDYPGLLCIGDFFCFAFSY